MSTRSYIGIRNSDKSIRCIYCHWDGYLENNGKILFENYKDKEKIEALLALGDLSSLDKEVAPPEGVEHSFDHPAEGITVAYHRDRGEDYNAPMEFKTDEELDEAVKDVWAEFIYLWDESKKSPRWTFRTYSKKTFHDLGKALEKLNKKGED